MGLHTLTPESSFGLWLTHVKHSLGLAKVPLSLFVAFSALFGYSLASPFSADTAFWIFLAVFLLSCGSATLNNIQDRDIDALTKRTRNRPLPCGRVSLRYAWVQASGLLIIAMVLLTRLFESPLPALLGLAAVGLYNGGYTPLKRKTLWAMVPGTLCGMLPPLIGWTASAGTGRLNHILTAMVIMGFWQIPHTWLVFFRYFPESSRSPLPSFSDSLSHASLKRILFIWVLSFAVLTVVFAGGGFFSSILARWLVVGNAFALGLTFFSGLYFERKPSYPRLFVHLNLALAVVMGLAISERLTIPF